MRESQRIHSEFGRIRATVRSRFERAPVKSLIQFLTTIAVNAVPALGWFVGGWNAGTMLAIYWFENVAATFFIGARIALHRRMTPLRGHFKYEARKGTERGPASPFLSNFLTIALVFSAGHGIFLAAIVLVLSANGHGEEIGLDWGEVGRGCGGVLLFLAVGFFMDLPGLRKRTFFWIEQMADRHLARVIIVHLSIIFGMLAVAMTDATRAFFGVFVGFKTMNDLATVLPQWDPEQPPRWLCRLMDRMPNAHPGMTFAEFWRKDKADEIERRMKNERHLRE